MKKQNSKISMLTMLTDTSTIKNITSNEWSSIIIILQNEYVYAQIIF